MTLFNSAMADRGCRLARQPFPHAPDRAASADASDLRASASFSSESRMAPPVRVPAAPVAPPPATGAVTLSDASAFILSLVAAHEGRAPDDIVAQLIAGAAEAIGLHALIMRDAAEVDLAELPDFARRAANRFRGGGP